MQKVSLWKEELLGAAVWALLFIGLPLFTFCLERF